jgi:hypothetical protein
MSIVDQSKSNRLRRPKKIVDRQDDIEPTSSVPHGMLLRLSSYVLGKMSGLRVFSPWKGAIAFIGGALGLAGTTQMVRPDLVVTGARAAGVDRPGIARAIISIENLSGRQAYDLKVRSETWCSPSSSPMKTPKTNDVTMADSPRKFVPKGLPVKLTLEANETRGRDVIHTRLTLRYTDIIGLPHRHQLYFIGASRQMKEAELPGSDDGKQRISWLWWLW